jgi:hypothetical protein
MMIGTMNFVQGKISRQTPCPRYLWQIMPYQEMIRLLRSSTRDQVNLACSITDLVSTKFDAKLHGKTETEKRKMQNTEDRVGLRNIISTVLRSRHRTENASDDTHE